jgi:hypothetical protein
MQLALMTSRHNSSGSSGRRSQPRRRIPKGAGFPRRMAAAVTNWGSSGKDRQLGLHGRVCSSVCVQNACCIDNSPPMSPIAVAVRGWGGARGWREKKAERRQLMGGEKRAALHSHRPSSLPFPLLLAQRLPACVVPLPADPVRGISNKFGQRDGGRPGTRQWGQDDGCKQGRDETHLNTPHARARWSALVLALQQQLLAA